MRMGDLSHRNRPSGCWSAVPGAILRARPSTRRRAAASEATSARSSALARARDVLPAESRSDADAGRLLVPLPQIRIRPPLTSPVAPHEPLTPRQKGESSSCIRFRPSLIPARPGPDEKASGCSRGVVPPREPPARSYPDARGRTSPHDVVPKRARSYPGALPRYDLAPQGTTAQDPDAPNHRHPPASTRTLEHEEPVHGHVPDKSTSP